MNTKKNTILVVDDEPAIRKLLQITLEAENMKFEGAEAGKEAIRLCASLSPDLVILDLGLPDLDGKEVLSNIREWSNVPVIVCSVRSNDEEVLKAFELGADDYITKPFNPDILLARTMANLRKAAAEDTGDAVLRNGVIELDQVRHEVRLDGEPVEFTPKEYDLLRYFMGHQGKMLTHRQVLLEVWGAAHGSDHQYLRVYVGQLRDKIEKDTSDPDYIITEAGIGYRMETVKTE